MTAAVQPLADVAPVRRLRTCAIVAALGEELRPILRRGSWRARPLHGASARLWERRFADLAVVLVQSGMGRANAERAAHALFAQSRPELLVVTGVSGGLTPGIAPGSLYASSRLLDGVTPSSPPDATRVASLLALNGVRPATFVTAARILSEPREKLRLGARVGGEQPALVDLETAGFAVASAEAAVPWIGLRAVSDAAEDPLPLDFEGLRTQAGELRRWHVAVHALGKPRSWAQLAALHARVRRGAESIARVLVPWLEEQADA